MVKGEGWPLPGSAELPRAARRALRRHRSRAGALPGLHFDHAAGQQTAATVRICSVAHSKSVGSRSRPWWYFSCASSFELPMSPAPG
eukprot:scaffold24360_cov67-Phaeocystis_antarctica.AAC.3